MQLNQIPNFRSASPVINNWQFRSSANLTDSLYVRPSATSAGKVGIGNKIKLGAGLFLTATAPVLAKTGTAPAASLLDKAINLGVSVVGFLDSSVNFVINAAANLLDKAVNLAINVLTMPVSVIYSYVTFGNAHQKGLFITVACIGAYAAGRRFAKNKLERAKEKWKHGIGAKFWRGTVKHVIGAAAAAAVYYALAPVISLIGKIVVDAWSKL